MRASSAPPRGRCAVSVTDGADAWLAALGERLPRHAAVLRALVAHAQADPRIRTVLVGCSVGRGVADDLSDVDAHMSVADDAWPGVLDDAGKIARGVGDPVEVLLHVLPDVAMLHRHLLAHYPDGMQLSLVLQPVSAQTRRGHAPDVVVLHDPDDRLGGVVEPRNLRATVVEVREWCVLGWEALADVVKYLRRGSAWEALERLHAARTEVWRLWAVAMGAELPVYGLTSVFDLPTPVLPPGIEATVPRLVPHDIAWAAHTCATMLAELWPTARAAAAGSEASGERPPALPLGELVLRQIEELPALRAGEEPVVVVAHDPAWALRFEEDRAVLERLLAPWLNGGIHHIGSTAVAGLAAKPVVDVLAGVRSLVEARAAIPVLVEDGWLYAPYRAEEMHWFCRPSASRRELHLHVVETGSPAYRRRLAFRDALRADPALRERYTRLKEDLAARFHDDRDAYTRAKAEFIDSAIPGA
jgi:GrpB-like predicted nucleotidyltransferase (UPF0157 family)